MDYKYIEQLLENYWNCETSTEEEQILRSFFSQKDVPVHLLKYKELFAYEQASSKKELGKDFDSRVLDIIEKPAVKAKVVTFRERIAPMFKAAAVIAIILTIGSATEFALNDNHGNAGKQNLNYKAYEEILEEYDNASPEIKVKNLDNKSQAEAVTDTAIMRIHNGNDNVKGHTKQ